MAIDVRLDGLAVGYRRGREVASDISVIFRGGELSCLIGPNGTGKSTLLKTISGFLEPKSGSVWFDDGERKTALSAMSHHDLARTVSIVLTKVPDVQNLTVEEMTAMGRSPYTGFWGRLLADDREVVRKSLSAVGILSLADRMIQTLSDGERQKVMVARALAQQTPVIVLDEPTAFLDYPSKAELMRLLLHLAHSQQKTIILSTHDLSLAVHLSDRLFRLADGRLSPVSRSSVQASMEHLMEAPSSKTK